MADGEAQEARGRGTSRARALAGGRLVRRRVHAMTVFVVVIALVITAVLVVVTRVIRDNNEDRLLNQRAHEAAAVTETRFGDVESPLASAAILADSTSGAVDPFLSLMDPIVRKGRRFISASLWYLDDPSTKPIPVAVAGKPPLLPLASDETIHSFLNGATTRSTVSIRSMLGSPDRRLGYAYSAGSRSRFTVYAEARFPKHRQALIAKDAAFSELDYAMYLGSRPTLGRLLASSSGHGIAAGERHATALVPFGNSKILLVVTPHGDLGGQLLALLPWILLGIGLVATVVAGVLTEYLIRRREHAEVLAERLETMADENRVLYNDQREVAETLQRSLLPHELPTVAGLEVAARYESGVAGTEVGGDWYDLLPLTPHRLLFSVGDVSGRGLEAAATMASLRYSMRAYALEGTPPEGILHKLTLLLSVGRNELFATVICGLVDTEAGTITVSRAGHPDLLVVDDSGAHYLDSPLGPAIGLFRGHRYRATTVPLVPDATYLAFTDGLVERRQEHLDTGLERLRSASQPSDDLNAMVVELVEQLAPDSTDDIALLALHWTQAAVATAADPAVTDRAP
jgi:serine phosphatase RsbU (regulator of sigma subunit)/type II secretory pathway pseudopilin PulG